MSKRDACFSVSQISQERFFSLWKRENFRHEHFALSKKLPFFDTYFQKKKAIFQLALGKKLVGFALTGWDTKCGIKNIFSFSSPYLMENLDLDDYAWLLEAYYRKIPIRNFVLTMGVPDYLDSRITTYSWNHSRCIWGTYCMDFPKNKDVLGEISSKYLRRDIRRTMKDPAFSFVIVGPHDTYLLDQALALRTQEKKGFSNTQLWQKRLEEGARYDCYHLFIAFYKGEAMAECVLLHGDRVAYEEGLVVAEKAKQECPYVGLYLKHNMMQWAMERGIQTYDLMGFNPSPKNTKERAIAEFKKKFSNREIRYPFFQATHGLGCIAKKTRRVLSIVKL